MRSNGSAIRDSGYAAHAVVDGVMTLIICALKRGLLHVMLRRSLPSHGYRQQRAIIDVVRYASLSEEKISVKIRDRIAVSPGDERARYHIPVTI